MCAVTWRTILPILTLVLVLGGCATASLSLSQEELRTIRIERVDVVYASDHFISWEKEEAAYVDRIKTQKTSSGKGKPWKQEMHGDEEAAKNEFQTVIDTPEGKQYMQGVLSAELKKRVSASILPKYQGTRPVVMEITVHSFIIPGRVQRVVLGGSPMLGAVTILKDAKTGKELAKLDRMAAGQGGKAVLDEPVTSPLSWHFQWFDDLEDCVFNAYLSNVTTWLQANREG